MEMTIEKAWFVLEHGSSEGLKVYLEAIKTIKKNCVDIVRCKDCKYGTFISDGVWCNKYIPYRYTSPEWFCADGERR